jgi:hypothetical protein
MTLPPPFSPEILRSRKNVTIETGHHLLSYFPEMNRYFNFGYSPVPESAYASLAYSA